MSDDRFTYIHLPHETSLWCYVDDQVDWAIDSLDDRFDQSVWDLIPPYQNEDDEGLLPSNAHPSYPYGNPYEQSSSVLSNPIQSSRLLPTNSLVSGTSLLATPSFMNLNHPSHWNELAIDSLLNQASNSSNLNLSTSSDQLLEPQNPNTTESSNRAPVLPTPNHPNPNPNNLNQTPRTPVRMGNGDLINPTWDEGVGSDDSDQDLIPQV
ncbi:uncharacterized protein MELLADRAFT_64978 [Melampsora larici-populina 98AG31]|uniref:Uncharacterized protein n=1 Tax=Melampsora larici-populina (strain 98AG31 / pathotype 3-4-7) TaxID=747676 RepID=F4RTI1_MELLP|nr:uncharacterized protein MELLADRAFT_64978 [Melampsora larici-populina 98AG31]EGG04259.1 hypothetical protein MELLADRAFT_64978 [Melampsora larici-populina 98AG31]